MKILFLTHYSHPHIGGVERHVSGVIEKLKNKNEITVITERYESNLKSSEDIDGVITYRISYPNQKYKGLIAIWKWFFNNRRLIKNADIIHCHDVFIWYLPFRFLFPFKKVFTTFHGWQGNYPIPLRERILAKLANLLSNKTIAIGKYIGKYYGIKPTKILYGAVEKKQLVKITKVRNTIVFVGRLELDTGLLEFLKWLDTHAKYQVDFVGDGSLKEICMNYGRVLGFIDPTPFLERSQICVPGGYLSYIEAKSYKCKIKTFSSNPLKEDYWKEIEKIKKFPTWGKIAHDYISLYNRI